MGIMGDGSVQSSGDAVEGHQGGNVTGKFISDDSIKEALAVGSASAAALSSSSSSSSSLSSSLKNMKISDSSIFKALGLEGGRQISDSSIYHAVHSEKRDEDELFSPHKCSMKALEAISGSPQREMEQSGLILLPGCECLESLPQIDGQDRASLRLNFAEL